MCRYNEIREFVVGLLYREIVVCRNDHVLSRHFVLIAMYFVLCTLLEVCLESP